MKPYYEEDGITIYHGDCREVLPVASIGSAALLITDPPYGIAHASNHIADSTTAAWMNSSIEGDQDCALRDAVLPLFGEWACFGSPKVSAPAGMRDVLIWDKGPASGMGDLSWPWKRSWELIFVAGTHWTGHRDEGVIKGGWVVTRASMGRVHPNEKPVPLMEYLIKKHPANLIVDPFAGSGSTLVAAKKRGRRAIGVEIKERYCEIAARRLAQGVLELEAVK